jgi:hypothetical protein
VEPAFSWADFAKTEKVGEQPSTLSCPECKSVMASVRYLGGWVLDECRTCRGVWFDRGELEPILTRFHAKKQDALGPEANISRRAAIIDREFQYRNCPRCQDVMVRLNYARVSGVIIDRCGQCGVWLDGGELEKISAFLGASPPDVMPEPPPKSDVVIDLGSADVPERRGDSLFDFLDDLFNA